MSGICGFARRVFVFSLFIVGMVLAFVSPSVAQGEEAGSHTFVFVLPNFHGVSHPFFDDFASAMSAAAESVGDRVDFHYAQEDHYKMVEIIQEVVSVPEDERPDAVIFMAMRNNGERALKVLETAGVNGFIINAGLTSEQYQTLGAPRSSVSHWLGEMLPDDERAGYLLAEELYNQAIKANPELKTTGVKMLAIEANLADGASVMRKRGLKEFAKTQPNLQILQVVRGSWQREKSHTLMAHMLRRHGTIDAVWAASDAMALGASEAATEANLRVGKDIFIGGVDWSGEGIAAIEDGRLSASAGGHILEGAWSVLVLHDYFNGHDFSDTEGLRMNSPMYIANAGNLSDLKEKFTAKNWKKLDFKSFSKAKNPEIKKYNFSVFNADAE